MSQNSDQIKPHDFDGIQEYDNQLPRWWLVTFVLTVVFGFGYWMYYHIYSVGPTQVEELAGELAAINQMAPKTPQSASLDTAAVAILQGDSARMDSAKMAYTTNCAACHGSEGQGVIGPNLTDEFWIHGGKPEQIQKTITEGVLEKGMLAWKGTLSDDQISGLVAYVLSLQGTNPANPKEPQGDKQ